MTPNTRLYWLHALTPLHVGAGRGAGYIDLPIVRGKVTNWPLVPGSAVKGVLADHYGATREERDKKPLLRVAFGRAEEEAEQSNSGSLVFTDARLACLPVRSLYGTFAWCTSSLALRRLLRDLDAGGLAGELQVPPEPPAQAVCLPQGVHSVLAGGDRIYFEDLDFGVQRCKDSAAWAAQLARWIFPKDEAWQNEFRQRFAVLHDDCFNFLCETGTEVTARVRLLEEQKTVAPGALWYEEALPAETVLAGLVWCDRVFGGSGTTPEQLFDTYCPPETLLQVGGKATVGRGQVRCLFTARGGRP
jgi:CRISPR-associated protein Cmr4